MGKDELVEILNRLAYRLCVFCNGDNVDDDKDTEEQVAQAKSAILAWFLENLPKEKENPKSDIWLDWDEKDFLHAGFNECLAEIKRRMGAKEKYGRGRCT